MNEPFLLSNLIELQELDNEIFKLISQKSDGETVQKLKSLEMEFKKLHKDKENIEQNLQLYFDAKDHIEKNLLDFEKSLTDLNEENKEELNNINKINQSLDELKPGLIDLSKSLQTEWKNIDENIGKYENEKKLMLTSFPKEIIDLYDDLKSKGVEVIAAFKRENQCGCCGVELTSNEMYEITNSNFQQCPYCMGVVI